MNLQKKQKEEEKEKGKGKNDGGGGLYERSLSPAGNLCTTLIGAAGYPCSQQTVETKDGYLLSLQRVSSSNNRTLVRTCGPPVLLLHGLFVAGDTWFLNSKDDSLGFILADQGFDVWVANFRGTSFSFGNAFLSPKDKEFWSWSWEDLAQYDLPVILDYIYSITNKKIRIIGHSQGTVTTLAALSQPNIAEMVEAAALLCPIAYLNNTKASFLHTLVDLRFDEFLLGLGITELNLKSQVTIELVMSACDIDKNCSDLLTSVAGKSCCLDASRIDSYFERAQPTSVKNLSHYAQLVRAGTLSKFDYRMLANSKLYGSVKPGAFNLSAIPKSVPIWMGYGGNDALADTIDVERAIKDLQSKPELLYLENYGHLDFVWSSTGKEDVFNHIIEFFTSLENKNEKNSKKEL
ncbi:triacylglycerol lipase 1-like [Euphorbia lathyris]|uniref:triacylglycerol lipase 1-like n=1 Tax=Euphorbia lathyris TaxID=212925 RepID=UPI003314260A